jgi:hypothetical protein
MVVDLLVMVTFRATLSWSEVTLSSINTKSPERKWAPDESSTAWITQHVGSNDLPMNRHMRTKYNLGNHPSKQFIFLEQKSSDNFFNWELGNHKRILQS